MEITWNNNVSYPLYLYGMIPAGSAFQVPVSQTSSDVSLSWTVDIAAQTNFLLLMADSGRYVTGGSTSLLSVGNGDTSCINATSTRVGGTSSGSGTTTLSGGSSSTSSAASSSSTVAGIGGSSNGGQAGSSGNSGSSSTNTGAIVGGVLGGVAFLLLLGILLFCCLRRNVRSRRSSTDSADPVVKSYGLAGPVEKSRRPVDLVDHDESRAGGSHYEPSPFRYPSPANTASGPLAADTAAAASRARARAAERGAVPPSSWVLPEMSEKAPRTPTLNSTPNTPTTQERSSWENTAVTPSTPRSTRPTTPRQPPSEAVTDMATTGHIDRQHTVRKTASSSAMRNVVGPPGHDQTQSLDGHDVDQPEAEGQRFVQHEDAGSVV